jgi:hypothetical protein
MRYLKIIHKKHRLKNTKGQTATCKNADLPNTKNTNLKNLKLQCQH